MYEEASIVGSAQFHFTKSVLDSRRLISTKGPCLVWFTQRNGHRDKSEI